MKEKPCERCEIQYPPYVMEWHHREPTEKEFGLGQLYSFGKKRILAEIEKCDLYCSNCHRIVEFETGKFGYTARHADVAQSAERDIANVEAAGS